jgi:hypothetical protein
MDLFDSNDDFDDQEDIEGAKEQLLADEYQAQLEEDLYFEQNTNQIIETSKAALAPRTLNAYTSFVPNFYLKSPLLTTF